MGTTTAKRDAAREAVLAAIPAFLRRKPSGKTKTTDEASASVGRRLFAGAEEGRLSPPRDLPPLPPGLRYSEHVHEEGGFAQRPGVVVRRWAHDAGYVRMKARELAESIEAERLRRERDAANKAAASERMRRMERGPRVPEGHLRLRDALAKIGSQLNPRHAKAAIDASKMIHSSYAIASNPATLARLKVALDAYVPPEKKRATAELFDPAAVIRFVGDGNPKKEGTGAHERWSLLIKHSGRTVAQFLAAKGNPATLKNAIAQNRAELITTKENSSGQSGADDAKVPRKDGERVRGEAKKAAAVGSGKRDRRKNAGKRAKRARH